MIFNNHFVDYSKGLFEARISQQNLFGKSHGFYAYFFEKYIIL